MIRAASEAGYYTNCPYCADRNDEKSFLDEIRYRGIFIPQRDATWEQVKDAYADMVKDRCISSSCDNPRKAETKGPFKVITCVVCGCIPHHAKCLTVPPDQYHCSDCQGKTFLQILKQNKIEDPTIQ
jgi:hypothetical protein